MPTSAPFSTLKIPLCAADGTHSPSFRWSFFMAFFFPESFQYFREILAILISMLRWKSSALAGLNQRIFSLS